MQEALVITHKYGSSLILALVAQLLECKAGDSRVPGSMPGLAKIFKKLVFVLECWEISEKNSTWEVAKNDLLPFIK